MNEFKEGHRVWDMLYGHGKVISDYRDDDSDYSVLVKFDNGEETSFTKDGREYTTRERTLFFKEIPIPADALVPPVEEIILNTGDIVALTDGRIVYVESHSSETNKIFFCHNKIPRNFEEAFGPTGVNKSLIRKVMGNLNA